MALLQKTVLETIHIRFTEAGLIQGISAIDKVGIVDDTTGAWVGATVDGAAREIDLADLDASAINPALSGQQATIASLTTQLATAKSDADAAATKAASDLATAQSALTAAHAQIEQLQAQLAAATAPVAGTSTGYTVPGVTPALVLDDSETAQTRFTSLVTLALLAEKAGAITDDTEQTITDKSGAARTVTTGELFSLILGYGQHCQALFAAALMV